MIKTEYIEQQAPALPQAPEYYPVQWHMIKGSYCIDTENAKNLLRNRAIDKAYAEELRKILETMREEGRKRGREEERKGGREEGRK